MSVNIGAVIEAAVEIINAVLSIIGKLWPNSADNPIVLDLLKFLSWVKILPLPA